MSSGAFGNEVAGLVFVIGVSGNDIENNDDDENGGVIRSVIFIGYSEVGLVGIYKAGYKLFIVGEGHGKE